jgi:hypothetical protein
MSNCSSYYAGAQNIANATLIKSEDKGIVYLKGFLSNEDRERRLYKDRPERVLAWNGKTVSSLYYQAKAKIKGVVSGEALPWHQGLSCWHNEDSTSVSNAVNMTWLLHNTNEFNGPTRLDLGSLALEISGSYTGLHRNIPQGEDACPADVSATLRHTVPSQAVSDLTKAIGLKGLHRRAGDVLTPQTPDLVHASVQRHRRCAAA